MSSVKITGIRTAHVQLPLSKPLGVGAWWNELREFVLVWIDTDAGHVGTGLTFGGYFRGQGRVTDLVIKEYLTPQLVGEDPRDTERLWNKMYRRCLMQSRKGVMVWGISALDIALWDIKAKLAGMPLWQLLGGAHHSLPAYATGGYYRPDEGLDELAAEVERYKSRGIDSMKLKLGHLAPHEDAERMRICREVLGPRGRIAVDANNAWPTAHDALRAVRMLEKYDLWFIEEPLAPDDLNGAAHLAKVLDTPIVNGEVAVTRMDLRDLVEKQAADILQFDALMVGGITQALKGVHLAECHDMQFIPAWIADLHLNLALCSNSGFVIEWHVPEEKTLQLTELIAEPAEFRDGRIFGHRRPGHGIEFRSELVERYRARE